MPTAALLIDWENLKIALLDGNYRFTPGDLARGLREAAAALAKSVDPGMRLDYPIAFAPAMALDPQTNRALQANGVTPFITHGGGQGADLAIAIRAMQLYFDSPPAEFFIIVSGDSDYLPLVEELNKGRSQCHIWGADQAHTPASIRQHSLVSYVAERLKLSLDDPAKVSPEQQSVFLFMCHRLLDHGIHLGSVNYACQKLTELGVWDSSRIQQMWKLVSDRHVIDVLPGFDKEGRLGRARRLAYEREDEVLKWIWVADLVVSRAYRRGHISRGELMSLLGQCGIAEADCASFLETLRAAGYLTLSGDEFMAAEPASRYGLVGAALRVGLAYYAVTCEGRQSSLGLGQLIKSHWPRFYKPGGHLTDVELVQSGTDAKEAVNRAVAMRVATWTQATGTDGRRFRAISIFEDHPVSTFLRRRIALLVGQLVAVGARPSEPVQYNDFVQHMASLDVNPWSSVEVDAWLSLLAAERVTTWRSGDIFLNNTPLRKAIAAWA
jgi:hypothetical protein